MTETIKGFSLSPTERDQIVFWRNVLKNETIQALEAILAKDDLPPLGKKPAAKELLDERRTKEGDFTIVGDDKFTAEVERIIEENQDKYLPKEEKATLK